MVVIRPPRDAVILLLMNEVNIDLISFTYEETSPSVKLFLDPVHAQTIDLNELLNTRQ
jgi:hypothetical protein